MLGSNYLDEMTQPLISIIITVLNGADTIGDCLDSIAEQSFTNYEVVVVDGGSHDRTVEIAQSKLLANKEIQVVPGLGLYAGLNLGVKLAKGQWLYFMGCDDELFSPATLMQVAGILESETGTGVKVIVGHVNCVKQGNLLRAQFGSPYWLRYQVHHQGMFYERSIFERNIYNEQMHIASDYEFNLRLAITKVPHKAINLVICNFGGNGLSENQISRGTAEMQEVHRRLFRGLARSWVVNYFAIQRAIFVFRRRTNLVNLKSRLRQFVNKSLTIYQI